MKRVLKSLSLAHDEKLAADAKAWRSEQLEAQKEEQQTRGSFGKVEDMVADAGTELQGDGLKSMRDDTTAMFGGLGSVGARADEMALQGLQADAASAARGQGALAS